MAGTMVTFPSNGTTASGYLATPKSGKGPGVIVLQEWWGLVDHIKHVCDRFAEDGFTALAPDMYHGKTAGHPDQAERLFMALNIEKAEKDMRGAVNHALAHSSTKTVGAVGFCLGGQLALFAATTNPSVGACVDYYGIHPNVHPDFGRLKGPVLGLFAETDASVTPEAARTLDAAIKKAGGKSEIHIYPKVGHAFFNDSRPDAYDKAAAEDSWKRTTAFFRKHLK